MQTLCERVNPVHLLARLLVIKRISANLLNQCHLRTFAPNYSEALTPNAKSPASPKPGTM